MKRYYGDLLQRHVVDNASFRNNFQANAGACLARVLDSRPCAAVPLPTLPRTAERNCFPTAFVAATLCAVKNSALARDCLHDAPSGRGRRGGGSDALATTASRQQTCLVSWSAAPSADSRTAGGCALQQRLRTKLRARARYRRITAPGRDFPPGSNTAGC